MEEIYIHLYERKLEFWEIVIYLKSHTFKWQMTQVFWCLESSFAFLLSYSSLQWSYSFFFLDNFQKKWLQNQLA